MGVVMAALIESAEQSARHRDTARRAAALDQIRPSASIDAVAPSDPASVISREAASREQVAVQGDPP